MKYTKKLNVCNKDFFNSIMNTQNQYFSNIDSNIKEIEIGTCINTFLRTKLDTVVKAKIEILEINYPYEYKQRTSYGDGNAVYQSFLLEKIDDSHTSVTYQEENVFKDAKAAGSYTLISLFYKFIFNMHVKKRFNTLCSLI